MNKITSAIVSYHFFYFKLTGDYDVIYIIVESPNGTYNRLMFGRLGTLSVGTHWGTAPNGMFYCGSVKHSNTNYSMALSFLGGADVGWLSGSPSGAVYGTSGAFTGWMSGDFDVPQSQMPTVTPQVFDTSVKLHSVDLCSPNTFNSMPPLFPITVNVTSPTTGMVSTTPWFPAAELPFLYIINLFNISPGSQISIGSDTYKVFPFRKKSDTWVSNSPDNGTYRLGFAIKTS
jgi:hypothetical protein